MRSPDNFVLNLNGMVVTPKALAHIVAALVMYGEAGIRNVRPMPANLSTMGKELYIRGVLEYCLGRDAADHAKEVINNVRVWKESVADGKTL